MIDKQEVWKHAIDVWMVGSQSLADLKDTLDQDVFARCIKVLADCQGRILTAGVGTSAAAARKIAHSLCCIERPSFFLSPGDAVHGELGAAQMGDVAILISKGGGTQEIVNLLSALRAKKIFIIGVTENEQSVLANASDLVLKVKVEREADAFNMLATTSTMAVVAVFDAICIALMYYTNYSREQFAVIHPGGAVGERLLQENQA
ncbi:MAG: SIS domain-containing protein [Candidatus Vecturithrix sp.]|nr:SIS domain-containing protein [Candidatus Vecturithrix sp.]